MKLLDYAQFLRRQDTTLAKGKPFTSGSGDDEGRTVDTLHSKCDYEHVPLLRLRDDPRGLQWNVRGLLLGMPTGVMVVLLSHTCFDLEQGGGGDLWGEYNGRAYT